jgi:hypothetical protein
MLQHPGHHENYVEQLLHLWIPCLCVFQNFTDKVYQLLLDFSVGLWPFNGDNRNDDCVGGYYI